MDDAVRIPIQLEVTDLNMGNVDAKDIQNGLKSTLNDLKNTFEKFSKSIDKKSATPELINGLKELSKGYTQLTSLQQEFNKAANADANSKDTQVAAEKLVTVYNSLVQKYQQLETLQTNESNLTSAYTDRLAVIRELATEMKYYKELAKQGETTYGQTEWEKIDVLVKSTSTTMKQMIDEARELVKTGEAFRLGGDKGDISEQLKVLQSLQGSLYGNQAAIQGSMVGQTVDISPNLAHAGIRARELAVQLQLAQRELDRMRTADAGELAIAQASYRVKELTEELHNADRAVEVLILDLASVDSGDIIDLPDTFEQGATSANDLKDTLESLVEVVAKLADTVKGIDLKLEGKEAVKETKEDIDKTNESSNTLKGTLSAVKTAFVFLGVSGGSTLGKLISLAYLLSDGFTAAGSAAQTIIPILGAVLGIAMNVVGKLWNLFQRLLNVVKQVASKVWELVKAMASLAMSGITKVVGKVSSAFGFIVDKLKEIFSLDFKSLFRKFTQYFLGFRSSYFLIRKIRQTIIDGMRDIASQSEPVNQQLSAFVTALDHVKGSLVSAFQPLISFVMPALTRFLNLIAKLLTYLAKFFAVLTGQGYYYDYTANMQDYANAVGSVGKAAKKATKDLMGFDEINRLSDKDTPSGGGSGGNLNGTFRKVELQMNDAISKFAEKIKNAWKNGGNFTEIGKEAGEQIQGVLRQYNTKLLPKIKETGNKLVTALTTFVNGLVSVPGLGRDFGATIANTMNTIVSWVKTAAETADWASIGSFIGDTIQGWFDNFDFKEFFTTASTLLNGISTAIINTAKEINWFNDGAKLADGFIAGLKNFDAEAAGQACHDVIKGVLDLLLGFLTTMDAKDPETGLTGWQILGRKIKQFFEKFNVAEISGEIGECAGRILGGLADMLLEADPDGTTFGNAIQSFLDALKGTGWFEKWANVWNTILKPQLISFWNWLKPILIALAYTGLEALWRGLKFVIGFIWQKFTSWLGSSWTGLWNKIKGIGTTIIGGIGGFFTKVFGLVRGGGGTFLTAAGSVLTGFSTTSTGIFTTLSGLATTTMSGFTTVCSTAAEALPGPFGTALGLISGYFTDTDEQVTRELEKSSKEVPETCAHNIKEPFESTDSPTNVIQNKFDTLNKGLNSNAEEVKKDWNDAAKDVNASFKDTPDAFTKVVGGIKKIFEIIPNWFQNIFSKAWQNVKNVFSSGGTVFAGIKEGVTSSLTNVVNGLISGINRVVAQPFKAINSALSILRKFSYMGKNPFSGLPWIDAPSIPKLAKGAVLPPNNPFLSIVGDQKSGTNVEAPLETIQEAVANVMDEQLDAMMAGFEAVVRAIQDKNMNVIIGDRDIGQAANRYNNSQSIRRGFA